MSAVPSTTRAAELFERHRGSVFGYCLSRLGRREDAEDAVQTTFVHAVRGLHRGVVPESEPAWLLGIARNVCLARRERSARRRRLEEACDPVELERAAGALGGTPEELMGLDDALQLLPEQQRRAVVLRDWRGLSYDEVAEQLGVSRAAVETLIFRGRDALADRLRDEPRTRRRRLAFLGNLGSVLAAAKDALAGAAALTKVAAAGAAALAVAGSGVALESALDEPSRVTPRTTHAARATPAAERAPLVRSAPETNARKAPARARTEPRAAPSTAAAKPERAPAPVLAGGAPTASAAPPAPPTRGEPTATAAPPTAAPPPAVAPSTAPEPAPLVESAVVATTTAAEETVAELGATVDETVAAVPATVDAVAAPVEAVVETTVGEVVEPTAALVPADGASATVPGLP